ncbi:cytochrome b/b6 domain-containing protein [uncultured Jannaschia sp.]|uniref:cytochrome b n=1 Tax=uncultured Jannaschia sp. TaxID=293347 RepID=UPI00262345EB|nr:cytochrome b/b6 domain-containing protein [uncultured Jannaschia sp.]
MSDTARPAVYSSTQMFAHWLIAFLILFQFASGGGMEQAFDAAMEGVAPMLSGAVFVHAFFGLTIFVLMLWRLGMRLSHGTPPPPETEPEKLQYLSRGTHYAFYAVLIGMPLAGLGAVLLRSGLLATAHAWTSKLLILLAAMHIAGALWHLTKRDGVVHRMIRRDPATNDTVDEVVPDRT